MSEFETTINSTADLATEEVLDLSEFGKEAGGAWPVPKWYAASVVEAYKTNSGKIITTADSPSNDGQSRNLLLALEVTSLSNQEDKDGRSVSAGDTRNMFARINYRTTDLSKDAQQAVREKIAPTRMAIAVANLGQLNKAFGFGFKLHPDGHILAAPFVGQNVDIRLGMQKDSDFNEVKAFAPSGTKAKAKAA